MIEPARVTTALVPAAGHGTRLRPFSSLVPKELVPIGTRPALFYVLDEARGAGLTEVVIVVREGKELLRRAADLYLESESSGLEIRFVEQELATGLADAILVAREALAGRPFALMLPDNVLLSPEHRLRDLVADAEASGRDVFGVLELDHRHSGLYGQSGLIDVRELGDGRFEIEALRPKAPGTLAIAPGERALRTCGRIVCQPHLLDALRASRLDRPEGELSEVPAYRAVIAERGALGRRIEPPLFDVGHRDGLVAANAWLGDPQRPVV